MRGTIKALGAALSVAATLQAGSAVAQYMPHLDPNLYILAVMNGTAGADPCMTGTAMSEPKIAEARASALAVMQAYYDAAQDSGSKSTAFHLDKNTKWRGGGAMSDGSAIDRQSDPLAVPGNVLEREPLRFYRGGTGATALGQWAVLDGEGQVAGVYTALFARTKKVWKLRELTLSEASEPVEPAAQYCRKPGDVIEYRLSSTKNWRESAEKSVDEAKTKLAAATETAAQAEGAAVAKPRDVRLSVAVDNARSNVTYWTKQLDKREKNLAQANEKSAEAQQDADELQRLTSEARNARALRVVTAEARGN